MKKKRIAAALLAAALAATTLVGCGGGGDAAGGTGETAEGGSAAAAGSGEIKEFDAFFAVPGSEINDDNEIQQLIAEKTGAKVKETWLTGQTAAEAVGTMIAGGEYPDFIDGGDGTYVNTLKILTELNRLDIDFLDYVVCTSVKGEHCGGLADILGVKDAGVIFAPYCTNRYITESFSRFYAAAESSGAEMRVAEYGEGDICGEAFFTFLSPAVHTAPGGAYEQLNSDPTDEAIDAASAVLWLEHEGCGIFYAGDAPSSVLERIVGEYTIASGAGGAFDFHGHVIELEDCKVYKAAGHGGEEYRSAVLTDLLSPDISVISVGELNAEGCPSAGTLADLAAHGNIYMTAYRGDVTIRIGGGTCMAECGR